MARISSLLWGALTSLKLTIVCLAALMVLVIACTLAQVKLGTFAAVDVYIRSWVVWWDVPGTVYSVPIFPGGALAGLVLGLNLVAAQLSRLELSWGKAGLWVVHAGLILLVAGEFVTGAFQVDTQLAVEEGQTVNFVESPRLLELAVVDVTDPQHDDVYGVPAAMLASRDAIQLPGTPVTLKVRYFMENSELTRRTEADPPPMANQGVGTGITARELPRESRDDVPNLTTVFVEPVAGGKSYGTWMASNALAATQTFTHDGRTYELSLRHQRHYLPYSVTLKDFKHDVYPGTQIPKNFSSLVHISNPGRGEERDVLIYMNQPLRYDGKAFYQASFGKDDRLSILQVVENPGWLLPYISCALVAIGLIVHFGISLRRGMRRRTSPETTTAASGSTAAVEA
ncbi:MAG TPA: cytochrome c biogenesis protein ResB [Anaeromyxobacteraceae bacterium]|nr:cytochrome c biogenesis protein ResB [Anaeromyxobacteraceae bacterium]